MRVAAGKAHSLALTGSGRLYSFGAGSFGALGLSCFHPWHLELVPCHRHPPAPKAYCVPSAAKSAVYPKPQARQTVKAQMTVGSLHLVLPACPGFKPVHETPQASCMPASCLDPCRAWR